MRIRHRELAQCQSNPTEWVSNQVNQTKKIYRMSYERCLREEINRFHQHRDVKVARQYLQEKFLKHKLKNNSRIQETLRCLNAYMNWFQSEGIMPIGSQFPLNFGLGYGVILGGYISRVDMMPKPKGYRAILLENIPLRWDEELRMPLIQRGVALTCQRPEDKFVVGIQELDTCDLVETSYSKEAINDAEQIAWQLAEEVARTANEVGEYKHEQLRFPI